MLIQNLMLITAASQKFYFNIIYLLKSINSHLYFQNVQIILYDLGLNSSSISNIKYLFPWVQIKMFPFADYPKHISELKNCGWKSIIIHRHIQMQQSVIWLDSTCLIRNHTFFSDVMIHIQKNGYFVLSSNGLLPDWCHPDTFVRMQVPLEIMTKKIIPAGVLGFDGRNKEIRSIIKLWYKMCLDKNVIKPKGSNRMNHRFDQALFNNVFYKWAHQQKINIIHAGEIDIHSFKPYRSISTRNIIPVKMPRYLHNCYLLYLRIFKTFDRFILKLIHYHKTLISGLHRVLKEKFIIMIEKGNKYILLNSQWYEYFADPFCLTINRINYLFFEKYSGIKGKGEIAFIQFDSTDSISKVETILEENWHLSYPQVFSNHKNIFMIPESSESKSIDLYIASEFPKVWKMKKRLMYGIDAADTTLVYKDRLYWLFCAVRIENSNRRMLNIFYSNSLISDKWKPHPVNSKKLYSNLPYSSGRGAGPFFRMKNKLIRPIQWNQDYYGQALKFMEILELNRENFLEKPIQISQLTKYTHSHHIHFTKDLIIHDTRIRWKFLNKL